MEVYINYKVILPQQFSDHVSYFAEVSPILIMLFDILAITLGSTVAF